MYPVCESRTMIYLGKGASEWAECGVRSSTGPKRWTWAANKYCKKVRSCNAEIAKGYYEILGRPQCRGLGPVNGTHGPETSAARFEVDAMLKDADGDANAVMTKRTKPTSRQEDAGSKARDARIKRHAMPTVLMQVRKQMLDGCRRLLDDESFRRKACPESRWGDKEAW